MLLPLDICVISSVPFCNLLSYALMKVAGSRLILIQQHAMVMCSVLCCVGLLYPWLFSYLVVNKNSVNYCSSSDKSKRRTKTVKKSLEPKWNQTFMYSPVHRREFRERMLEITLWDQARVREEESEFLGEVRKPNPAREGCSHLYLDNSLPL